MMLHESQPNATLRYSFLAAHFVRSFGSSLDDTGSQHARSGRLVSERRLVRRIHNGARYLNRECRLEHCCNCWKRSGLSRISSAYSIHPTAGVRLYVILGLSFLKNSTDAKCGKRCSRSTKRTRLILCDRAYCHLHKPKGDPVLRVGVHGAYSAGRERLLEGSCCAAKWLHSHPRSHCHHDGAITP